MYDNFDAIEPIDCANCGEIHDQGSAYASNLYAPGFLICARCKREERLEIETLEKIESIEFEMDEGQIGKREGKKRINELKLKPKS